MQIPHKFCQAHRHWLSIAYVLISLSVPSIWASQIPLANLSAKEQQELKSGKIVYLRNAKGISCARLFAHSPQRVWSYVSDRPRALRAIDGMRKVEVTGSGETKGRRWTDVLQVKETIGHLTQYYTIRYFFTPTARVDFELAPQQPKNATLSSLQGSIIIQPWGEDGTLLVYELATRPSPPAFIVKKNLANALANVANFLGE